jgi:hypothetical protein
MGVLLAPEMRGRSLEAVVIKEKFRRGMPEERSRRLKVQLLLVKKSGRPVFDVSPRQVDNTFSQ